MKKQNIIAGLVLAALLMTACTKTEFNAIPESQVLGDSLVTTTTIEQLLNSFHSDIDKYSDVKLTTKTTSVKDAGLFTTCPIYSNKDLIINGVVISSDVEGNIYKYIIVKENGINGQALKISIDAGSLSGIYPVGQKVSVRLNGFYLGKYAQSPQIGTYYVNLDKVILDTLNKINVYRIEPGRIPLPIAMKAIRAYGLPDPSLAKADTMNISQIKAAGSSVFNKLVCIKNAFFTGKGADYGLPIKLTKDEDYIFAPSTNGIGYPQSREIQDGTGSIFVSTSEYSKFATYALPPSTCRGNITAIVGWYNDKKPKVKPEISTGDTIYHQLTLRGLFDLGKGYESYHATIKK